MYSNGIISKPVFAFSLGGPNENSFVDIGVIQQEAMSNIDDLVYIDAIPG